MVMRNKLSKKHLSSVNGGRLISGAERATISRLQVKYITMIKNRDSSMDYYIDVRNLSNEEIAEALLAQIKDEFPNITVKEIMDAKL